MGRERQRRIFQCRSRADFLPPIDDPVYGFGAVNVEAQHRNPSSLLNWTRRLIAMRRAHRAFGRGTLRFLRPGNRKILAYLREHEGEAILCVANLSRAPQAVELDLSAFRERVPVELMGRSRFPPIGDLPYLLTLSGHGFYSFRLATDVEAPAWHEERPVPPDLPVLVLVDTGWRTLFARTEDGEGVNLLMARRAREQLERLVIPGYFRGRPWFVDRDAVVEKYEFSAMREWSTESGSWLLATVAVTLAGAKLHRYAIPLALAWEDEDEDESRVGALLHATLAKVRRRARVGVLFDAFWDDRFCCAVVAAMERGETLNFGEGAMLFSATDAYPGFACPVDSAVITHEVSAHGRLRVNLDDRLVLKSYRWLLDGTHPELEMSRFLTMKAKFPHVPQLAGTVEFASAHGERSTLAILECYSRNQGDAWHYTLDYLALMKTLGLRTAQFHQALALPDEAGAFGSEPISAEEILDWIGKVRHEMDAMFELLEQALPRLSDAAQRLARSLRAARPRLYRRIVRAASVRLDAMKTRCHGNYHFGQVWLVNNDFLIANYGGGPGWCWCRACLAA
ncbi:MAG: alpha-glucosidase C-terminal domain-containing protein [Thiobacillus sp.]|nr:alpha-glucosidase C-terminal domain-containing protein [Thiobacillus sp.]